MDAGHLRPRLEPVVCRRLGALVALPAIRESYGAGAAEVQWVVNAYLLPLSALLLLGGALGDHFGRRRLLTFGTALFAAASLLCALAPSLPLLLGGARGPGRWRRAAAAQQPGSCSTPLFGRDARARGRHLGGRGRRCRSGRALARRLAGRDRRLAGDFLHQPAACPGRDRSSPSASLPKAAMRAAGAPIMPARCSPPSGLAG